MPTSHRAHCPACKDELRSCIGSAISEMEGKNYAASESVVILLVLTVSAYRLNSTMTGRRDHPGITPQALHRLHHHQ